jgi:hypothetical protein
MQPPPPPSPFSPFFSATLALFPLPSLPLPCPLPPSFLPLHDPFPSSHCAHSPVSLPLVHLHSRNVSRPLLLFLPRFPSPRFFSSPLLLPLPEVFTTVSAVPPHIPFISFRFIPHLAYINSLFFPYSPAQFFSLSSLLPRLTVFPRIFISLFPYCPPYFPPFTLLPSPAP